MTYTDADGNYVKVQAGGQVIINGKVVQDGSRDHPTRRQHMEQQNGTGRRQCSGESQIQAGGDVIIGDVVHGNVEDVVVPGDRVVVEGKGNTVITTGICDRGDIMF